MQAMELKTQVHRDRFETDWTAKGEMTIKVWGRLADTFDRFGKVLGLKLDWEWSADQGVVRIAMLADRVTKYSALTRSNVEVAMHPPFDSQGMLRVSRTADSPEQHQCGWPLCLGL
jgi:hypothetical protein